MDKWTKRLITFEMFNRLAPELKTQIENVLQNVTRDNKNCWKPHNLHYEQSTLILVRPRNTNKDCLWKFVVEIAETFRRPYCNVIAFVNSQPRSLIIPTISFPCMHPLPTRPSSTIAILASRKMHFLRTATCGHKDRYLSSILFFFIYKTHELKISVVSSATSALHATAIGPVCASDSVSNATEI